jgi:WD40 repeat protein
MSAPTFEPLERATANAQPYPGLRPYLREEGHLFFGRDAQIYALLERLDDTRFLAVVGTSGCGKSSLVRAGVLPALEAGLLQKAGPRWRFVTMRPGGHPLRNLGRALLKDTPLGEARGRSADAEAFLGAALRRGPCSLVEALRDAGLGREENVLLLVDQFEEVFRFRHPAAAEETEAFVALLLATAREGDQPIHIVLTMRSDFLGDCARFLDLPEALNDSQFLTPRMTRAQLKEAIEGPAQVCGGRVEPSLVNRLLNDMGPEPDHLPLMQHVLLRLWGQARGSAAADPAAEPVLRLSQYEALEGLAGALNRHAESVFATLTGEQPRVAEVLFRALSERDRGNGKAGPRDTRRPAQLKTIAATAATSEEEVAAVVEVFRDPELSVLTPPEGTPLTSETLLDITHESLLRRWDRLRGWVEAEGRSAETYRRLEESARYWKEGRADYLGGAELDYMLIWLKDEKPSGAWAERYGGDFKLALDLLEQSRLERKRRESERKAEEERQEAQERKRRRLTWLILVGIGALVLLSIVAIRMYQLNSKLVTQTGALQTETDRATKLAADLKTRENESKRRYHALSTLRRVQGTDEAARPQRSLLLAVKARNLALGIEKPTPSEEGFTERSTPLAIERALRRTLARIGGIGLFGKDDKTTGIATYKLAGDPREWLVTITAEGKVQQWELKDLKESKWAAPVPVPLPGRLPAEDSPPRLVEVAGRRPWLLVQGKTGSLRLWDLLKVGTGPVVLSTEANARKPLLDHHKNWLHLEVPLDGGAGRVLGPAALSHDFRLWDLRGADPKASLRTIRTPPDVLLTSNYSYSEDGRWFALLGADGAPLIWDLQPPQPPLAEVSPLPVGTEIATRSQVANEEFTSDGRLIVSYRDGTVHTWVRKDGAWNPEMKRLETKEAVEVFTDKNGLWAVALRKQSRPRGSEGVSPSTRALREEVTNAGWLFDLSNPNLTPYTLPRKDKSGKDKTELRLPGFLRTNLQRPFWVGEEHHRLVAQGASPWDRLMWDLKTDDPSRLPVRLINAAWTLTSEGISPDGRWYFSLGFNSPTLQVWDLWSQPSSLWDNAIRPTSLRGHDGNVSDFRFSATGRWLVTLGSDSTIRVWDMAALSPSAEPVQILPPRGRKTVAVTPDRDWFAYAHPDGNLRLWNTTQKDYDVLKFPLPRSRQPTSLQLTEDGRWLVSYGDGPAILWNLRAAGKPAKHCKLGKVSGTIRDLIVSPDERWLVATLQTAPGPAFSPANCSVSVWDVKRPPGGAPTNAAARELPGRVAHSFDADGRLLTETESAVSVLDLSVRPFDEVRKVPLTQEPNRVVQRPLVTRSGRQVVLFPEFGDATALALSSTPPLGRVQERLLKDCRKDLSTAFVTSPNGRWLVSERSGQALVWDLWSKEDVVEPRNLQTDGELLEDPNAKRPPSAVWSVDRNWAFTYSDKGGVLWEFHEQDLRRYELTPRGGIRTVAFTSDSKRLVTTGQDVMQVWPLADLKAEKVPESLCTLPLRDFKGIRGNAVAMTATGEWLTAAGLDGQIRVWKTKAPGEAPRIVHHGPSLPWRLRLFIRADGEKVILMDEDTEAIRVYSVRVDHPDNDFLELARRTVGRPLRDNEKE